MNASLIIYGFIILFAAGPADATNIAPAVKIDSPRNRSSFWEGETISFSGTAVDLEDGNIPEQKIAWRSDEDGHLGNGRSFHRELSVGKHIVILTAEDSGRKEDTDIVFVIVRPRPSILITHVPAYGTTKNLKGLVLANIPGAFSITVYLRVEGMWYNKPYWDKPLTIIHDDGTWECDVTTRGEDEKATTIVAFLVPSGYKAPLLSGTDTLPEHLEKDAFFRSEKSREKQQEPKSMMLRGICYGPSRDNEDPDKRIYPSAEEMGRDLVSICKLTHAVRTYGSAETPGSIPSLCEKAGIDCYPGAWLGKNNAENDEEIKAILLISNQKHEHVKGLIIGNEVLLRRDLDEKELSAVIRLVKTAANVPVSTGEMWRGWINHPGIAIDVDFLLIHIHPYWDGVAIEKAALHVVDVWKHMKTAFPGKRIVIGETGWPLDGQRIGKAVPGPGNQARFLKEFAELAEKEAIEYFFFKMFDDKWKTGHEVEAGTHWGIYNANGSLKDHMKEMF